MGSHVKSGLLSLTQNPMSKHIQNFPGDQRGRFGNVCYQAQLQSVSSPPGCKIIPRGFYIIVCYGIPCQINSQPDHSSFDMEPMSNFDMELHVGNVWYQAHLQFIGLYPVLSCFVPYRRVLFCVDLCVTCAVHSRRVLVRFVVCHYVCFMCRLVSSRVALCVCPVPSRVALCSPVSSRVVPCRPASSCVVPCCHMLSRVVRSRPVLSHVVLRCPVSSHVVLCLPVSFGLCPVRSCPSSSSVVPSRLSGRPLGVLGGSGGF